MFCDRCFEITFQNLFQTKLSAEKLLLKIIINLKFKNYEKIRIKSNGNFKGWSCTF